MATSKNTIKNWFKRNLFPTQEQFWAWIDSYYHKDEQIPVSSIDGINDLFSPVNEHFNDPNAHAAQFSKVKRNAGTWREGIYEDYTIVLRDNELYKLSDIVVLPFNSTNFEDELLELKWIKIDNTPQFYKTDARNFTADFMFALSSEVKDLNLVVFSDSTGDQNVEWAYFLMEYLASSFPLITVKYRFWNSTTVDYDSIVTYQTGTATVPKELVVYIGGASGQGLGYGLAHFNTMTPVVPDLVLFSYGHNDNYPYTSEYLRDYLKLVKKVTDNYSDSKIILIGQNPKSKDQPTYENGVKNVYDIMNLAASESLGFINVMQAYFQYGNYNELLTDGIHPNAAGQELWLDKIKESFPLNNYAFPITHYVRQDAVFINANDMTLVSAGLSIGIDYKSGDVGIPYIELDQDTQQTISSSMMFPQHWKELKSSVFWYTPTDSDTETVVFNSMIYKIIPGENYEAGHIEYNTPNGDVDQKIIKTELLSRYSTTQVLNSNPLSPAVISFTRMATHGSDTYNGKVRVLGVLFERNR